MKPEQTVEEMAESYYLEVIHKWKHFWMNQRQNSQDDYENYLQRAMGVDANMAHHLASMIHKAASERAEILVKAIEQAISDAHTEILRRPIHGMLKCALEEYRGGK